eukprot:jgi/Chlat1/8242/Chrsp77S07671
MLTNEELAAPLRVLPPVAHAFAYGSGVFPQRAAAPAAAAAASWPEASTAAAASGGGDENKAEADTPMTDYILAVEDPAAWHAENVAANRPHYAWLPAAALPALGLSTHAIADVVGAGVHFNTLVPYQNRLIKYGVMSLARLRSDLATWQDLYAAGRLHKPVKTLVDCPTLATELADNRLAALAAALLLLPPSFTEPELYTAIAKLSYGGDVRLGVAEDPRKLARLVSGSFDGFREIFARARKRLPSEVEYEPSAFRQGTCPASRSALLSLLPGQVLGRVAGAGNVPAREDDVARWPRHAEALARVLSTTVARSSRRQAVSSFLTAGVGKSVRYVGRKMVKAWRGRFPT